MKIAMLGHKRIPGREGGVEVVVQELSTRMAALGHSVTCFNRSGHNVAGSQHDAKAAAEFEGVRIREVPTIDRKGLAAFSSSFFAALKAAFGNYDIVHIHAEGPAFFSFFPKWFGKKVIVTIHGIDWQRAKWGRFASWYIRCGEKNAVRYADEIIVLSKSVQDYFLNTYGRHTNFIPNGVTRPLPVSAESIEGLGLAKDSYILYLGRIVPEKGLTYLIHAWKNVQTDKKLVIAGGSSDSQSFFEEMKELAADDERVLFTGFVQGRLLEELYSNAYVYCLPSDLEGMPLSLLEAMSYGNCCLTSDIPECTEVVENQAAVFEKGNEKDLREKLQLLCDHSNVVQAYREKASDFICGKYNWDNVVEQTLQIYNRIK